MISGGTAAIPRTDYSYAAETAAGTEEGGATSEPESEPESETESEKESETGSEQRTENTGVKETDQGLETNIESESETMQDLSAVEENRRESEESTEGQFPETELGENGTSFSRILYGDRRAILSMYQPIVRSGMNGLAGLETHRSSSGQPA